MTHNAPEQPWMPGPEVSGMILLNPEGTRHLVFDNDKGLWSRIFEGGSSQTMQVSDAVLLRPSDVDTIIKWTMAWCLNKGYGSARADELIDNLANGMKATLSYLIERAGLH